MVQIPLPILWEAATARPAGSPKPDIPTFKITMENKTITMLLLGMFLMSFASACTVSVEDRLQDNTVTWKWDEGEDVEVRVTVENDLANKTNFTTEIEFFNQAGEKVSILSGGNNLREKFSINSDDSKRVTFDMELREDILAASYKMVTTTYISGNESIICKQSEVSVRINAFDSCSGIPGVSIVSITDPAEEWVWWLDEEGSVKIALSNSNLVDDEYTVELMFYDSSNNEVEMVESQGDLLEDITFSNGTEALDFSFDIKEKFPVGNYGLYVRVSEGNDCVESRLSTSRVRGRNTYYNYDLISIQDVTGIVVTDITGPMSPASGSSQTYTIKLTNTGADEPKVLVSGYSQGVILGEQELLEFKAGTTRTVSVPISIPERTGGVILLFFADYDYNVNTSRYYERTSNYNHDEDIKIIVGQREVAPTQQVNHTPQIINSPATTPAQVVVSTPVQSSESSFIPYLIVLLIFTLIGAGVYYFRKKKPSQHQSSYPL